MSPYSHSKSAPPFSLRLTPEDRARLERDAVGMSLGAYIRWRVFDPERPPPKRKGKAPVKDHQALARVIALLGQPRIVVFHEKDGRRHAHCLWSRIDADTMTARPLPFFKMKLREISKDIYLEQGWQMPRGLMNSAERDPRNFDLAEWQQAKRHDRDPRHLKGVIQECWAASDTGEAFSRALEARGLHLARGDRRGHVAVTYEGEVLSIARMIGKPAREVTARLGKPDQLRSVEATRVHIASVLRPKLQSLMAEADRMKARAMTPLLERRDAMKANHTAERKKLYAGLEARQLAETKLRSERMRRGVLGLWDRLTGTYAKLRALNEAEALASLHRDRSQRDNLLAGQMQDRRLLQRDIRQVRHRHATLILGLHRDLAKQEGPNESRALVRLRDGVRPSAMDHTLSGRGASSALTNRHPRRSPGLER